MGSGRSRFEILKIALTALAISVAIFAAIFVAIFAAPPLFRYVAGLVPGHACPNSDSAPAGC
jgi:hypothetical protein